MLKNISFLLTAVAMALVLSVPAYAGNKANKGDKANKPKRILAQYDTNGNGVIDGDEKDAVKKAYEKDPSGPLKQFDLNNDGKLDDTEIAAIKGGGKGAKGNKAAKKAKKAGAASSTTTTSVTTEKKDDAAK